MLSVIMPPQENSDPPLSPGADRAGQLLGENLQSVLEWMPIGCILFDRDFLVTDWNRACEIIFGFSKQEMLGKSPYDMLIPASARGQVEQVLAALRQSNAPIRGFNQNLTKDGRLIDCEWHNTALRDAGGEVSSFICMALDVTERVKSQEALKRSEQIQQQLNGHLARTRKAMEQALQARIESEAALLQNKQELKRINGEMKGILDAVEAGMILYSRELQVIWSNRGAAKYFQTDSGAPQPLWSQGASAPGHIGDCFQSGCGLSEQIASNGRILDVSLCPILEESGEVQSVLEVVRDVTAKSNLQAEALRSAHLASLGELAAGVAHEINNPIHGIVNYAELLIREFPGESRICEVCARIVKESERIARIVRALLDFSRKGDGGKVRVRIEQALDEAVTLCHSQLKKDEIQVLFDRQNSELLEVSADPQQIVQVVLNLISNARYSLNEKYPERHPDKSITCSLSKVSMAGSCWAKLAIADRGGGIPQAMLSKVLNPFFTTKPNGRGTGLGLSICNTIIVDHGGLLEISSVEGTSTTVSFLLPAWGGNGG